MLDLFSAVNGMTHAQYDKAKSIIKKYLADRSTVRNDPTLDVVAKKAKIDQLG